MRTLADVQRTGSELLARVENESQTQRWYCKPIPTNNSRHKIRYQRCPSGLPFAKLGILPYIQGIMPHRED